MSLTGGKANRFMFASIPREVRWERENQRGHWVDSWDAKRSTSATPNRSHVNPPSGGSAFIPPTWVSVSTESTSLGSGPLGHGALSGTTNFPVPKEEAGTHACSGCTIECPPGDWCETPPPYCPSWRWHESAPGAEESEWELDEPLSTPGRLCARLGASYLVPQDGHDCCLTFLGIQYAEEAFVDSSCSPCGDMTIS